MNEIKIFESTEFGAVRTLDVNDQPWFVGKDVAEALGYSNPQKALRDHVDSDDRTVNESFTVNGTAVILINESGLYSLIMSSKLPSAKKFKRWVTSEVLPALRKNGSYGTPLNFEEIISKTAAAVASEVMKQVMPMLSKTNVTVNTNLPAPANTSDEPLRRIRKKYKYTTPSKVALLSKELREEVDEMILSGDYSCQQIANYIMAHSDIELSQMSVNRYKRMNFTDAPR